MTVYKVKGASESGSESLLPLLDSDVDVTQSVVIEPAFRDSGSTVELEIGDDDLLEVELEDGFVLWTTVDRLEADVDKAALRERDEGGFPSHYPRDRRGRERGIVAEAIRAIRVLKIDLPEGAALKAAAKIEGQLEGDGQFFRIDGDGALVREDPPQTAGDEPILILIHGTASSTANAYGGFFNENSVTWREIHERYAGRVYGFEHRTLTKSPLQNALEFLDGLPANANLHLVTHSRGGLVGDLLAHGRLTEEVFADADLERELKRAYGKKSASARRQLAEYRKFNQRIVEVAPNVSRYVRVACPAAGTTLASRRLDVYLSIVIHLLRQIPGAGPLLGGLGEFAAAVAKERTDPETLPGLEAQMPTSPLVRLLNGSERELDTDLTVLAGDSDGFIKNLANLFYWRANDLVVDTRSMYGGAPRVQRLWHLEENRHVTHVNYFRRAETAQIVKRGLFRDDASTDGFESRRPKGALRGRVTDGKPTEQTDLAAVVLLPGIMGSNLAVVEGAKRNRIWIDRSDLIRGRGRLLAVDSGKTVEPAGVFDGPYDDFRNDLVRHNLHVMPLAYDWRLSLVAAAKRLDALIAERLRRSERPVYIIAHSMGGLVSSLFMRRHAATWERLRERGGRLVQAGTPNRGSYSIPRILSGHDDGLRLLAMLDVDNGLDRWISWASRFPGVLELSPGFGGADFSQAQTWKQLGARTAPRVADLQAAERTKQELAAQADELADHGVLYVAGGPEETPIFDAAAEEIRFTDRGDGKVDWESGIPPGAPTWYVPVKHGDLLNTPGAFAGLRELILEGTTDQLSAERPAATDLLRGAPPAGPPLAEPAQIEFVPSSEDLEAAVLGMSPPHGQRQSDHPPVSPCEISIVHGDLRFTERAVMIGHYRGDQIVHAEAALDRCLDGALSARHQLGVYPGEIGSAEVLLSPDEQRHGRTGPTGAVVLGLGNVGELSPGTLTRTVEAGLLRYAQACRERGMDTSALSLSTLLVGTGEAGVSTLQALEAFMLALRNAGRALQRLQLPGSREPGATPAAPLVHFAHLEFVELYEDVALEALHTLTDLPGRPEFVIRRSLSRRGGGRQRAWRQAASGWWPRIQISSVHDDADSAKTLKFTSHGGRARAPEMETVVQRALVDRLVVDTLHDRGDRNPQIAETLFELLIPASMKAGASERRDLQLVLDAESAAYPWELLADRRSDDGSPVGVAAGLLRQLRLENVPPVSHPENNCALIVGDPPSAMVELPGAQLEAGVVAEQFAKRDGWDVVEQIRGKTGGMNSTSVVQSILTNDIRILHLAGHGIYDAVRPERSGMVIGGAGTEDDPHVLITAAEVQQMRLQPELVFINCCHLGRIEKQAPYHKLAASLAAAFIQAGVKAVVAASWPVNDQAAATFSAEFYKQMLSGAYFGTAVNAARQRTYEHESNTWGAYQCYGEPGFRLLMDVEVRARAKGTYYSPDSFLDPSELVLELGNLQSRACVETTANDRERIAEQLGELNAVATRREWLDKPDVVVSLARVHGEIGDFETAIDLYEQAARVSAGGVTLRDLEQLANYRSRRGASQENLREVRGSIADLKRLLSQHGETTERLSLLGAAYKRAAGLVDGRAALRDEVRGMTEAYERAAGLRESNWYYPASNALLGVVLLGGPWSRKPRKGTVAEDSYKSCQWSSRDAFDDVLKQVRASLRQQTLRSFWDAVALPDLDVIEALADGDVSANLEDLIDGYQRVMKTFGSGREIDSVISHWTFTAKVADRLGSRKDVAALQQLTETLTQGR